MQPLVTRQESQEPDHSLHLLQEELETTNREVMLLTLEFEQRVAERTAELAQSNQQLLKEVADGIRAAAQISKLNRDLERRAALLEAANEELEAFSGSVSHDLRNPLGRIIGFASLLQDGAALSEETRQKYTAHITDAGRKMASLIDDLLRLSHSSQVELLWTRVDLSRLIGGVVADFEQEMHMQSRKVEWTCDPLPTVSGDPSLLRLMFVNLISNALKYTRPRDPAKVHIGTESHASEQWTIFVRDNGVGFDPAKALKIFGAFQRFHSNREFEGTGIGLANVRRIALRHNGRVWADSTLDEGATFFVSLPKHQLPEPPRL
jgi:signal transduction histidine kinase